MCGQHRLWGPQCGDHWGLHGFPARPPRPQAVLGVLTGTESCPPRPGWSEIQLLVGGGPRVPEVSGYKTVACPGVPFLRRQAYRGGGVLPFSVTCSAFVVGGDARVGDSELISGTTRQCGLGADVPSGRRPGRGRVRGAFENSLHGNRTVAFSDPLGMLSYSYLYSRLWGLSFSLNGII